MELKTVTTIDEKQRPEQKIILSKESTPEKVAYLDPSLTVKNEKSAISKIEDDYVKMVYKKSKCHSSHEKMRYSFQNKKWLDEQKMKIQQEYDVQTKN